MNKNNNNNRKIYLLILFLFPIVSVSSLIAATETPLRQILENAHFSEEIIKYGIYAKTSKDVYCYQKRKFVRGLARVTLPFIYEPDVLTWQLAMQEHHKKLSISNSENVHSPIPTISAPIPILPDVPLPTSPSQITLTPLLDGSQVGNSYISYDSAETMKKIIKRAKSKNITKRNKLKGYQLKQEIENLYFEKQ